MAFINHLASLVVNVVVNTRRFNRQMSGMRGSIVGAAAGFYLIRAGVLAATGAINTLVKSAAELESGFVKVERIVRELRESTFRSDVIRVGLELPGIQISEIQGALQGAVRLGIRGKNALIEFSKQVTIFSELASITGEKAALQLGRIAGLFKVPFEEVSKLSNAILVVSQEFRTTAADISDVTEKIAGFSAAIGLSVNETIGWAAALKSAGQTSTITRSALTRFAKVTISEQSKIQKAFKLTNEELGDFIDLVATDANEAMIQMLLRLKELDKFGQIEAFKELELSTVRILPALLALADNIGEIRRAQEAAERGARDNTEALIQLHLTADTTTAKLKDLKESWDLFKATLGETQVFNDAIEALTTLTIGFNELTNAQFRPPQTIDLNDTEQVAKRIENLKKEAKRLNVPTGLEANESIQMLFGSIGAANFFGLKSTAELRNVTNEINRLLDIQFAKIKSIISQKEANLGLTNEELNQLKKLNNLNKLQDFQAERQTELLKKRSDFIKNNTGLTEVEFKENEKLKKIQEETGLLTKAQMSQRGKFAQTILAAEKRIQDIKDKESLFGRGGEEQKAKIKEQKIIEEAKRQKEFNRSMLETANKVRDFQKESIDSAQKTIKEEIDLQKRKERFAKQLTNLNFRDLKERQKQLDEDRLNKTSLISLTDAWRRALTGQKEDRSRKEEQALLTQLFKEAQAQTVATKDVEAAIKAKQRPFAQAAP